MLHSLLLQIKQYLYTVVKEMVTLNGMDDPENYFLLNLSYILYIINIVVMYTN
jgi:hypothetical protein